MEPFSMPFRFRIFYHALRMCVHVCNLTPNYSHMGNTHIYVENTHLHSYWHNCVRVRNKCVRLIKYQYVPCFTKMMFSLYISSTFHSSVYSNLFTDAETEVNPPVFLGANTFILIITASIINNNFVTFVHRAVVKL